MDPQSIINVYHRTMKEAIIGLTVSPTASHFDSFHEQHGCMYAVRTHSADPSHSQTDSHHTPHSEDTYCLSHLSGISWNAADVVARLDVLKKTLLASGQRLTFNRPRACALSFRPKALFLSIIDCRISIISSK
jgi:hypothetical protein